MTPPEREIFLLSFASMLKAIMRHHEKDGAACVECKTIIRNIHTLILYIDMTTTKEEAPCLTEAVY